MSPWRILFLIWNKQLGKISKHGITKRNNHHFELFIGHEANRSRWKDAKKCGRMTLKQTQNSMRTVYIMRSFEYPKLFAFSIRNNIELVDDSWLLHMHNYKLHLRRNIIFIYECLCHIQMYVFIVAYKCIQMYPYCRHIYGSHRL
jgi:hypothetical protein